VSEELIVIQTESRTVRVDLSQQLYLNDNGELWCHEGECTCLMDKIRGDSRRLTVADLLDILTQHREGVIEP
jgi:hypothetical protein